MNLIYRLRFDNKAKISSHKFPSIKNVVYIGENPEGAAPGHYYDVESRAPIADLVPFITIVNPPLRVFKGYKPGYYVRPTVTRYMDEDGFDIPNNSDSVAEIKNYLQSKSVEFGSKERKADLLKKCESFII